MGHNPKNEGCGFPWLLVGACRYAYSHQCWLMWTLSTLAHSPNSNQSSPSTCAAEIRRLCSLRMFLQGCWCWIYSLQSPLQYWKMVWNWFRSCTHTHRSTVYIYLYKERFTHTHTHLYIPCCCPIVLEQIGWGNTTERNDETWMGKERKFSVVLSFGTSCHLKGHRREGFRIYPPWKRHSAWKLMVRR